jgi:predicted DNA binding CopG/RHH family protein
MKTKRIDIRMTEYEIRQLDSEAERRGMTRSDLVRSMIAKLPEPNIKPS